MSDRDRTTDENAALRARISALSAASLRINASLDLETVLNEVVESAARSPARATVPSPPSTMPASPRTSSLRASPARKRNRGGRRGA